MVTISLDDARADIAGLLDRVEKGEDVLITRRVCSAPEPAERVSMDELLRPLDELRDSMAPSSKSSADLLRELRDERY
jgi:hypothetical protein